MEKKHENLTWDDIKAMFAETDRRFKETDRRFKETDRKFAKTEKMIAEKAIENAIAFQETRERIKELGNHIGGISNSIGDMAEDYFYNTFKKDKTFANQQFDMVKRNVLYDKRQRNCIMPV